MQNLILRGSDTTPGTESGITILINDPPASRNIETYFTSLLQSLLQESSGPSKTVNPKTNIEFKTPEGITGIIEFKNGINSKQRDILDKSSIFYKESGQSLDHLTTERLIQHLKKLPGEMEQFSSLRDQGNALLIYYQNSRDIQHTLLPTGANPNIIDQETGKLPLQLAIERETKLRVGFPKDGHTVIPALLKYGADPYKKNGHGESPMDTAKRLGRDDVIEFFKAHAKERHSSLEEPVNHEAVLKAALAGLRTSISLTDRDSTSVTSPSVGRDSSSKQIV